MNWNALAAWIYEDSTPDLAKAAAHGITVIYVDPRSANAALVISGLRAHNITPGIYTSPDWEPSLDGPGFAKWTSAKLNQLLPRGTAAEAPPFMADLEGRDLAWQTAFLGSYRNYQPARPSSATVAPFQGGSVPTTYLNGHGFHLYPQLYYGSMAAADAAAVVLELTRQGFPAAKLHPMYDGAALPSDARDGCLFTLERLP